MGVVGGAITEVMAPHCGTLKMPDLQELTA